MKRISLIIVTTLALAFLVFAQSRTPQPGTVKKVDVTAQTLASQPAGKSYLIDLTRKGTVYEVALGIDYSRIRVRTSRGEVALSEAAKRVGLKPPGTGNKLLLGTSSDLRLIPARAGTSSLVDCQTSSIKCRCSGYSHCLLLELGGCCSEKMVCDEGGCWCWKKSSCSGGILFP